MKSRRPQIPIGSDAPTRTALEAARRALRRNPLDRLPTVDELVAALGDALPEAARGKSARRVFVPPRPRGQHELLGRLQALVSSVPGATDAALPRAVVVSAPEGSGKSLLLRELKWRLQIRAAQVLEISADGGDVTTPLLTLARQLALAVGDDARGAAARRARSRPRARPAATSAADGCAGGGLRRACGARAR